MKRIAVYPGSFDPVTNGHVDVIERATNLFDEVIVGVAVDTPKNLVFSDDERIEMMQMVCKPLNVRVEIFKGIMVDWAHQLGACAIIRGLRALADFEYEFQMALTNRKLRYDMETVFLMTKEDSACISSSTVKEIARLNGPVELFVPECIAKKLKDKLVK